jgi:CHAT domain-containing protein
MVPVFAGLLSRQDGADGRAAARLYGDVFDGAIEELPPGIARLIVIPDGPLQRLPFDALRATPDAAPLAARYELAVAPSATLWLHWRTARSRVAGGRALAFADPELDTAREAVASSHRQALVEQGLQLGRLEYARQEGRALERHVGAADVLTGRSASERALKERDLQQYDLVHFAAHAVSDETRPERSAVLLSSGAESEDGLLQAREIQELDLTGRIVVLSACQTASGAVLNGEGVLSLARSFFEAGARAVIGTRWPIRDDDAAVMFEAFYRRLGEGASLSEALAHAKRESIDAGRPASAWASVELLGDGTIRPFAGRASGTSRTPWRTAAVTLFMSFLAWVAWSRATRAR